MTQPLFPGGMLPTCAAIVLWAVVCRVVRQVAVFTTCRYSFFEIHVNAHATRPSRTSAPAPAPHARALL